MTDTEPRTVDGLTLVQVLTENRLLQAWKLGYDAGYAAGQKAARP